MLSVPAVDEHTPTNAGRVPPVPILSVIGSGSAAVRRERTDAGRRVVILAYAVSYPPVVRPHCSGRVSHPWGAVADACIRAAFRHRTAPWRGFGFGQPRHRARNGAVARSSAPHAGRARSPDLLGKCRRHSCRSRGTGIPARRMARMILARVFAGVE
jgi:hypothetical protein